MEHTSFAVSSLGKQDIILRFTWLQEHNPEIDWWTWEVVMSQCPAKCHMCRSEVWKECQECQRVEQLVWVYCSGPHPLLSEEESKVDSTPDSDTVSDSTSAPTSKLHSTFELEFHSSFNPDVVCLGPEDALAEGDCLLYVDLPPEVEHIHTSVTTSQRLAEALQNYTKTEAEIPEYLQEFEDVFSKESFDTLLEQKP